MSGIEIVTIGNELLAGSVLNTNSAYISRKLLEKGFAVFRQTTLPDDLELLKEGLSEAMSCSPLVIATGGLGPTLDDNSKKAAAELFDSPLQFDERIAEELKQRFGGAIAATLEDQATLPTKALILSNTLGTAQGLIFNDGLRTLILLPGVPWEMQNLFEDSVMPFLEKHFQTAERIFTEKLHLINTFESQVDPDLRALKELDPEIDFGIYPSYGLLTIIIKSLDPHNVQSAAAYLKRKFADRMFDAPSGKIEEAIHQLFLKLNLSLSAAESCTGGKLSAKLTALAGASGYFRGGCVVYSNDLKVALLNVPLNLIKEKGAVSKEVAEAMAEGMLQVAKSDFSVAITGIAGPDGGSEDKPVGTIFYAIKEKNQPVITARIQAFGSRKVIIEYSVNTVLSELYKIVKARDL